MVMPCLCSFIALLRKYDKQKTYPNPCRFEYELYGGELGTRTPDPLRVMHDDFLIFKTMIRQIGSICYRSATNSKFNLLFSSHKSIQTSFLSDAHMLLYSQSLAESV